MPEVPEAISWLSLFYFRRSLLETPPSEHWESYIALCRSELVPSSCLGLPPLRSAPTYRMQSSAVSSRLESVWPLEGRGHILPGCKWCGVGSGLSLAKFTFSTSMVKVCPIWSPLMASTTVFNFFHSSRSLGLKPPSCWKNDVRRWMIVGRWMIWAVEDLTCKSARGLKEI